MGGLIYLLQLLDGVVRVNLRRAEAAVTQYLLYRPDVGPLVQHVRRESVPQHMRTLLLQGRDTLQYPMNNAIHKSRIHRPTLVIDYQYNVSALRKLFVAHFFVIFYHLQQRPANRDYSLLISLAKHLYLHRHHVNIAVFQPPELRLTHASLVKHLEQQLVANDLEVAIGIKLHLLHVVLGHELRQFLWLFQRFNTLHWRHFYSFFTQTEFVKRAQCRHFPVYRAVLLPFFLQVDDIRTRHLCRRLRDVVKLIYINKVFLKLLQISLIR